MLNFRGDSRLPYHSQHEWNWMYPSKDTHQFWKCAGIRLQRFACLMALVVTFLCAPSISAGPAGLSKSEISFSPAKDSQKEPKGNHKLWLGKCALSFFFVPPRFCKFLKLSLQIWRTFFLKKIQECGYILVKCSKLYIWACSFAQDRKVSQLFYMQRNNFFSG